MIRLGLAVTSGFNRWIHPSENRLVHNALKLIGRDHLLFADDLAKHGDAMADAVRSGRFLVIGGAGSIGSAVVRELFRRSPRVLHVVDISENNLSSWCGWALLSLGAPWVAQRVWPIPR